MHPPPPLGSPRGIEEVDRALAAEARKEPAPLGSPISHLPADLLQSCLGYVAVRQHRDVAAVARDWRDASEVVRAGACILSDCEEASVP